jgi:hypothetical protein
MTNPYAGQEPYEAAWQYGFDYGAQNPTDEQPQAPDFSSWGLDEQTTAYVAQVWAEGALAGRGSGAAGGGTQDGETPVQIPDDLRDEMVNFDQYYPELLALDNSSSPEEWAMNVAGLTPEDLETAVA